MKNIYAFTETTYVSYPGYISVNEARSGVGVEFSVRSHENGFGASLAISLDQAEELADKLKEYVTSAKSIGGHFTVNTKPYPIDCSPLVLSYEDICRIVEIDPRHLATCVASTNGSGKILYPGDKIVVSKGMHINCMVTGNA